MPSSFIWTVRFADCPIDNDPAESRRQYRGNPAEIPLSYFFRAIRSRQIPATTSSRSRSLTNGGLRTPGAIHFAGTRSGFIFLSLSREIPVNLFNVLSNQEFSGGALSFGHRSTSNRRKPSAGKSAWSSLGPWVGAFSSHFRK